MVNKYVFNDGTPSGYPEARSADEDDEKDAKNEK